MAFPRREFLATTALALAATVTAACRTRAPHAEMDPAGTPLGYDGNGNGNARHEVSGDWGEVRQQFRLSDEYVHMSALLISSHPTPVRNAIDQYRRELDEDPVLTLQRNNRSRQDQARAAAARYIGGSADDLALTDSTTMAVGLMYNGLRLRQGQEILTTEQDYYVTHEAVRVAAERAGATSRETPLYEDMEHVSRDGLVDTLREAIRPETRVLGLTWVHSSTGLKLPLQEIAEMVADVNRGRDDDDRVLLAIDGVHGFGVENVEIAKLGLDFFAAGCHKWLFGPRGTGILWGRGPAWAASRPIIPSFTDDGAWDAWLSGDEPAGPTTASRMAPGGFKAFEHLWAVRQAFEFHQDIGKARVEARTHELARQLKEGLAGLKHVTLVTPMDENLSSGIVSFDVDGLSPWDAVKRLRDASVIASVTPYAVRHARLTPSIRNTPQEVDRVIKAVAALR